MQRGPSRWRSRGLAAALAVILPASAIRAQGEPDLDEPAVGPGAPRDVIRSPAQPTPGGEPFTGTLRIGLADSVRLAIENNLDVELRRFDALVAEQGLRAAWGAYDPELFGQGGTSFAETPIASEILAPGTNNIFQRQWFGEAGLQGLIPWLGGSYSLSYASDQTNTDSPVATLSPAFNASVLGTLQLPLLRDLFWSPAWTAVRVSRIGLDQSREQFATDLMDIVRRAEDAYWNLIARIEATRVARKSLETAQALLDQTQAQYEVGVVSRVELVQAEAGVADREFRLITADAQERNARDALVDVVLGPYLGPRSDVEVELTDPPEEIPVREVDPEAATARAFESRPELAVARKEIERRQVELRFASNQRLPRLDVVGSYGYAGLSGRVRRGCTQIAGVDPATGQISRGPCQVDIPSDWVDANDQFFEDDGSKNYGVRGVLSFPIGNVGARADYDTAQLELRRARTALVRLEQSIVTDIRQAARNLLASIEGIEAAQRAVAAAEEQLRAERVRLEYGESTPFDVLQREEDLVTAESQLIGAQNTYHNSVTALERAQGTILERNGVVVEGAAALR